MSTPDNTIVTLPPLFVAVGILSICAWIMLWRTHRQQRAAWLLRQAEIAPKPTFVQSPPKDS